MPFPLVALALAASSPGIVPAYSALCAAGDASPAEVLARADAAGWRSGGPGVPAPFDPRSERFRSDGIVILKLAVNEHVFPDEKLESCGISSDAPDPELIEQTRAMLGVQPSATFGTAANFFAGRDDDGWVAVPADQGATWQRLKAQGRAYSIIATAIPGHGAFLNALHFVPLTAQPKPG